MPKEEKYMLPIKEIKKDLLINFVFIIAVLILLISLTMVKFLPLHL